MKRIALAAFLLLLFLAIDSQSDERIKVAVKAQDVTGLFVDDITRWMEQAVGLNKSYELVGKEQASYLLVGTVLYTSEKPQVDVVFNIMLLKTGAAASLIGVFTSGINKEIIKDMSVGLKDAVQIVAMTSTLNVLNLDWNGLKKKRPDRKKKYIVI